VENGRGKWREGKGGRRRVRGRENLLPEDRGIDAPDQVK